MFLDNLLPAYLGAAAAPAAFLQRLRHPDMVSFGLLASLSKMRARNIISDIDSVWDIGANHGQFAFMANHVWPYLPIYSFEPDPDSFKQLEKNFRRFNIPGEIFCSALGDSVEEKLLQRYSDGVNNSFLEREDVSGDFVDNITVNCTTLDTIAKSHSIHAAFLKLDVQGFELAVLSGGQKFLESCRFVQVEVAFSPAYTGAAHAGEIILAMRDYGFECIEVLDFLRDKRANNKITEADLLFQRSTTRTL